MSDTSFKELRDLATKVLELKQASRPRRPIVIEFCGSPKSGKSSCINSLNIFLKRNGFKTKVLTERASACPIQNKCDPFFNTWTTCSAITGLTDQLTREEGKADVILADRALFDALCWFDWLREKTHLSKDSHEALMNFVLMREWRQAIDIIYVFTSSPNISLEREYAALLTREVGSIMNKPTLSEYNDSISRCTTKYKDKFRKVEELNTDDIGQNDVSFTVTKTVLQALYDLLVEKIGYFDFDTSYNLKSGYNPFDALPVDEQLQFANRDIVEGSLYIQPVPIAVITNKSKDSVLVLKKQKQSVSESSPERDKLLLYAGGHIRVEDVYDARKNLCDLSRIALSRELKEELGVPTAIETDPFVIYTPDNEKSKRHVAICFEYIVDFDNINFKLDKRELVLPRGKSESGRIYTINEISKRHDDLESWSKVILDHVFNEKNIKETWLSLAEK